MKSTKSIEQLPSRRPSSVVVDSSSESIESTFEIDRLLDQQGLTEEGD